MYEVLRAYAGKGVDPIHRENREGDIRDSLADISRGNRYLGYEPRVRMKEGLQRTFDWFKHL
jgi:UDP-N-acetylglucosamine 4-epimerase